MTTKPKPRPNQPSQQELVRELSGTTCRCSAPKRARQTFCVKCYYALPQTLRGNLYRRLGAGYEEAYAAAVEFFKENRQ